MPKRAGAFFVPSVCILGGAAPMPDPDSNPMPPMGLDAPLHAVMQTTRAMRRLRPDPVDRDLLRQLVEAATWAPSASNAQAYSWVVVDDRETMTRLTPLWQKAVSFYLQTVGTIPAETMSQDRQARMYRALTYQAERFASVPALIIPCYDLSRQSRELRRRQARVARALAGLGPVDALGVLAQNGRAGRLAEAASVYPGVQNLLLTARALGLGATITTTHLLVERQFKQVLGIPRSVKTFAVIPVGFPKGRFGPVRRRSAEEAIHWGAWSPSPATAKGG